MMFLNFFYIVGYFSTQLCQAVYNFKIVNIIYPWRYCLETSIWSNFRQAIIILV